MEFVVDWLKEKQQSSKSNKNKSKEALGVAAATMVSTFSWGTQYALGVFFKPPAHF